LLVIAAQKVGDRPDEGGKGLLVHGNVVAVFLLIGSLAEGPSVYQAVVLGLSDVIEQTRAIRHCLPKHAP
jgi:hypothetical protein